jgi:Bacterial PH domain
MAAARYLIPQHPTLRGPHTKDDLYMLVERGSIARGEIITDRISGRSHRVGDLLSGMKPPRAADNDAPAQRPSYQEFSGDTPWEMPGTRRKPEAPDEDESDLSDESDEADLTDEEEDYIEGEDDEGADYDEEEEEAEEEVFEEVDGERVIYRGHPSWLAFSKGLLLALLLLAAAVGSIQFGGFFWLAIGVACSSLTFCCVIIARQHRDYLITEERVEVVWGLIGRSSKEVRIQDIRSIDVIEGGLLGFLGIGTVDFASAGTDGLEVQFRCVRRPHRVKEQVRQLQKRQS